MDNPATGDRASSSQAEAIKTTNESISGEGAKVLIPLDER